MLSSVKLVYNAVMVVCLQAKARNVEGMRDRMFSGDKINFTEVTIIIRYNVLMILYLYTVINYFVDTFYYSNTFMPQLKI